MEHLFKELFQINRSITGDGVRKSIKILQKEVPYEIKEFSSGLSCFDWVIPKEWNIKDAYIQDLNGKKIIDFQDHNLHVLNYSAPVNKRVSKDELLEYIYTRKDLPDAIPYRTSYYQERWGFCLEHNRLKDFTEDEYNVVVDSTLTDGSLSIAELVIKGESDKEVLFSTYMCHPSMANNELSGPIAMTMLAKYLMSQEKLKYTYRFVIAPETIGSIVYLSQYCEELKDKVIAGYVISQVGITDNLVYKQSRNENSLSNRVVSHLSNHSNNDVDIVDFTPNGGGDQRQYCSLGINMPIGYIGRSLGGTYKEYHTSLDSLDIISYDKMNESVNFLKDIVFALEVNNLYMNEMPYCEPNLGMRGLYPTIGGEKATLEMKIIKYILGYSDGKKDILEIANLLKVNILLFDEAIHKLLNSKLIVPVYNKT